MRIRGLYRTRDMLLGECVRVHWSAGDAAPVLSPVFYRSLGGQPDIAELPDRETFLRSRTEYEGDPLEMA